MSSIGEYLRNLRRHRQCTIDDLARRAGVAPSTLRRWENGTSNPRMEWLVPVLNALQATPAEYKQALSRIETPSAARQFRHEYRDRCPLGDALPGAGDLWRALRRRSGLSAVEVARRMGVSSSTVTRWEQSRMAPDEDRLPELFDLLAATPDERSFLLQRRLSLAPPLEHEPLDDFERRLGLMAGRLDADGGDLCFLSMEAEVWKLSRLSLPALDLLGQTHWRQWEWLFRRGRFAEAHEHADLALAMARKARFAYNDLEGMVFLLAQSSVHRWTPRRPAEGLKVLDKWLFRLTDGHHAASTTYRDIADYHLQLGDLDGALAMVARAEKEAEECVEYQRSLAHIIHARILLKLGKPMEALAILPGPRERESLMQPWNILVWCECFLNAGDRSTAHTWLTRYFHTTHHLPTPPAADEAERLARKLG